MPKIKIHRKKEWFIKNRVFEVYVDGQRIGYISNGETYEFDVPLGQHKIRVKMGRFGSNNYDCTLFNRESGTLTVSINYAVLAVTIIYLTGCLFMQGFLMDLNKGVRLSSYFNLIAIGLLGIYFQTVGRNTYLKLKEKND